LVTVGDRSVFIKMRRFRIATPVEFDLDLTVRSYGFFALAPNIYDKENRIFSRPIYLAKSGKVVNIKVQLLDTEPMRDNESPELEVQSDVDVNNAEKNEIKKYIVRMFRLDADYIPHFYNLFPPAKKLRFGRMFRSPTLFEDIVKTMTNVNTHFKRTQLMNTLLCEKVGKQGAFPTPQQVTLYGEDQLAQHCNVGYRADRITRFASDVCSGAVDLSWFERCANHIALNNLSVEDALALRQEMKKRLLGIHGFGEFSANNLLQILGIFEIIPSDSETARLLRQSYDINVKNPKEVSSHVQSIFQQYAPYQFLVYWFKLYQYEKRAETQFELLFEETLGTKKTKKTKTTKKRGSNEISVENAKNPPTSIELDTAQKTMPFSKRRKINPNAKL